MVALEEFFKKFSEQMDQSTVDSLMGNNNDNISGAGVNAPIPKSFNESLDAAMKMISEGAKEIKENESPEDDELLDRLLEQFKDIDPNDQNSMNDMVETMMGEMLNKETLYTPVKHIVSIYPDYISNNRSSLSKEVISQYEKQFNCFTRLLGVLETSDADKRKTEIMTLLTEVQEYGNPPQEVLSQLMPGLSFDEEGNPKVPNALPGMESEFMANGENQCCLM
jgi:peroxin-19